MHLELLSEGVRQRFRAPLGPPCIAPVFRDTRHTAHCGTRFHVRRCGAVSRSDCRSSDGAELFPGHQSDWKARHDIDRDPNAGGWSGSDQPYEIVVLVGNVKAIGLRDAPFSHAVLQYVPGEPTGGSAPAAHHSKSCIGVPYSTANRARRPEDGPDYKGHDAR